ncbi:MAG: prepilin-type N-terminal cleavage/methylation domain-containing protein [Gemmatimonadota bacterium]|nr:prepilin-type N-terminal cleavage/methylation domain-containing protein [Gemmatimonadota bacterium]
MKNARGFTLVEILIALVLMGIVSTALYQLLVANQRIYRAQVESVAINESARAAVSIVPSEVREVSAGDGDVLAMNATSLTYKSMQSLYVQCADPNTGGLEIILDRTTSFGFRAIDAAEDSILIFAEGDPSTRTDDGWLSASVTSTTVGTACPGSRPSIIVGLAGVSSSDLMNVSAGAPVRTFRPTQILLYQDGAGDWWLGGRQYQKTGGSWSTTQPLLGPLSGTGIALTYTDAAGAATVNVAAVARVGITVQSQSSDRVYRSTGSTYLLQNLVTQVAVRNNPTY